MTGEDIIDCVLDVDIVLAEIESALSKQNYPLAMHKVEYARAAIDDLRQDDCNRDSEDIELHMMNILK
jgi:hypothetical protein